jgi:hypothetical protein
MKLPLILVFFSLTMFPLFSFGEPAHNHEIKKVVTGVEALSPELRKLLTKEMQALEKGILAIIPAYISANWSEIASIADKMENSYILKQSLTDNQMHELHTVLPDSFVKLDQEFHYLSGMLSHAAKMEKTELVGFYFSKLSESCVGCHSQYAVHKFPAFKQTQTSDKHEH